MIHESRLPFSIFLTGCPYGTAGCGHHAGLRSSPRPPPRPPAVAMAPPPPPPPPPMCFPFSSNRARFKEASPLVRRDSEKSDVNSYGQDNTSFYSQHSGDRSPARSRQSGNLVRSGSVSTTRTLASDRDQEKLQCDSDSESYDVPPLPNNRSQSKISHLSRDASKRSLVRADSKRSAKWGYGWGIGKAKERELLDRSPSVNSERPPPPQYDSPTRSSSRSSHSKRPPFYSNNSSSTLVGSAYERKINDVESIKERIDTAERLEQIRKLMVKDNLDYYIVPSEDAHQSEYVSAGDKRREWISGFSGSAGQAIVSKTAAYLVTDSRYWLQARAELDSNWLLITAGAVEAPKDWIDWLVDRAKDAKVGIDARMISHEKATRLNTQLNAKGSKLIFPPQNFIDLCWKDKPTRSKEPWIRSQRPAVIPYSKSPPTRAQAHVGTLITSLSNIAYLLNLRGSDIPFNPLFYAYLFISIDRAILFLDAAKLTDDTEDCLRAHKIERRDYNDIWPFLRRREWGEGRLLINAETSYAISLMLTHFRYTVVPSLIDNMKAVKNDVELEGLRRAYLRDGAAYVKWLAWLEHKIRQGYDITEYEAAWRLTEYRRQNKHYWGLAYENISASGPNAALPHYSPSKSTARTIDREAPYLNDSGAQYRDGTCDTTRTVHFGRPTQDQSEAYTRVLQGHIAVDSVIFPEGTTGAQLDVLARRALWKDGLNYLHGTGHGFGSFLNVHEGPHGFSSNVPLVPGHVITNEPGFYLEGKWGMRIESALCVRPVRTKGEFNGDIWLGFERLTCVPIQTRMVKENMLTKEEKQWLKDHNKKCLERLEPLLKEDKRALKWLKREAERGIGIAGAGPGGFTIDWD
ncbi:Creatinase aminopeptidase [Pisolithus marmoratus]|nr:Creatinase aminopeptidase [Pisolithus marmoratus]